MRYGRARIRTLACDINNEAAVACSLQFKYQLGGSAIYIADVHLLHDATVAAAPQDGTVLHLPSTALHGERWVRHQLACDGGRCECHLSFG